MLCAKPQAAGVNYIAVLSCRGQHRFFLHRHWSIDRQENPVGETTPDISVELRQSSTWVWFVPFCTHQFVKHADDGHIAVIGLPSTVATRKNENTSICYEIRVLTETRCREYFLFQHSVNVTSTHGICAANGEKQPFFFRGWIPIESPLSLAINIH